MTVSARSLLAFSDTSRMEASALPKETEDGAGVLAGSKAGGILIVTRGDPAGVMKIVPFGRTYQQW